MKISIIISKNAVTFTLLQQMLQHRFYAAQYPIPAAKHKIRYDPEIVKDLR